MLDFGRLAELLGYDRKLNTLDFPVAPRGYRVLGRIPRIPKLVVQKIIHELGGFEEVLAASDADLEAVDGVGPTRAKDIREGLRTASGGRPGRPVLAELTATGAVAKRKEQPISELDEAMEAVFEEDVEYVCDFEEGDKVVYPHHGAGMVLKKETQELMGEERDYLTIKILHNELTVMVPCENAGNAGLRRVIDEEEIKKVTDVLTDDVSEMPKNWNRRFKYNREKIKTGDVFELAEVVRNLAIREMEKGLSTGEKQMYTRAKKILASEFMYALDKDEDGAEEYLDGLLEERFAATAYRLAVRSHRGHRGRRLRGAPRSRRPEGLRAARRDGRWSSGRSTAFRACDSVRSIVVAAPPGHIGDLGGHDLGVVPGGATRAQSVANALEAVGTEYVAIHDAARPLLTPELSSPGRRPRRGTGGGRRDRRRAGHRHDQASAIAWFLCPG